MRIGFYYPRAGVGDGGVTMSLLSWASNLAFAGNPIRIWADQDLPSTREGFAVEPVRHARRGRLRVPKLSREQLGNIDLLVLSSGWLPCNWAAAQSARRFGIPYVVVPHGAYDPQVVDRHRATRRLMVHPERAMLEGAAVVQVFFPTEEAHVHAISPRSRVVVAPTGVRRDLEPWVGGGESVLWYGRYDIRHKGLDLLAKSLATMPAGRRPKFDVYGRDSYDSRPDVLHVMVQHGVSRDVDVHGPLEGERKLKVVTHCAGYVHPSRWECHAGTLADALARGVPSLVSSSTSIARVLEQNGAALIATPGSADFGATITRLLQDSAELSERSRSFAEAELDWSRSIALLLESVKGVVG